MSLVANVLEDAGIVTVIIGSAIDIVEHCGVPRFLYTDFPLGNPCGPPWQTEQQAEIAAMAVDLLQNAAGPRTTVKSNCAWPGDGGWRQRYNYVGPENHADLQVAGERRRQVQAENRENQAKS